MRTDAVTRRLYATDASGHQIEPAAVGFPRNANEASALIRQAVDAGLTVTPRGAGTGLVGGALGEGLVVDFGRHNRALRDFHRERRTIRVGAGVVLDDLNRYLKPAGLCFGPDVATSSRATLGGMIANNSSGSHVPIHGTTADHIESLEAVLADGRCVTLGPGLTAEAAGEQWISTLAPAIRAMAPEIEREMPADLLKRWPGYGVDRWLRSAPTNWAHLFAGSEGTLGAIVSAELRLVPLPTAKGLGVIFFASVAEAMQATVELLNLQPAAIEHVDRLLLDQTRGQRAFQAARDLLELDARPCEAALLVEFFGAETTSRLAALASRRLGLRTTILRSEAEANLVWNLRKAGVALLTGCRGPAKPVTGIEDTAVRPAQLPAYVEALQGILRPLSLEACFYGHAASGLLHVRPVLDLHRPDDARKFRQVLNEVSALVRQFKGSLAAEHGVGITRTEFMQAQMSPALLGLLRKIKSAFDPGNHFNPGKIIDDGRYRCDTRWRLEPGSALELPFEPVLAFSGRDESFVAHLEQCNGCGGCRKATATMCPTFVATGEEAFSTRGRANVIRGWLQDAGAGREPGADCLTAGAMETVLTECLGCKACATECPSNVNLALLKAELLHARNRRIGLSLRQRLLGSIDRVGALLSGLPRWLRRGLLENRWAQQGLAAALGFDPSRPWPEQAEERFDHWFHRRPGTARAWRGPVYLWDDTFARHQEPEVARAAVTVLEAAGFAVHLVRDRVCCGRPAFSQGWLERASSLGRKNLLAMAATDPAAPILFLEPSCYSMIVDDYRELKLPGMDAVAARCALFEEFIGQLLEREPGALRFRNEPRAVVIHAHCHVRALRNPGFMGRLVRRLPGRTVTLLDSSCCGMAGAFGYARETAALSRAVAAPLIQQLSVWPADAVVVASGTSCRHQIAQLSPRRPWHMAQLLADALAEDCRSTTGLA